MAEDLAAGFSSMGGQPDLADEAASAALPAGLIRPAVDGWAGKPNLIEKPAWSGLLEQRLQP